ncbi:MAG: hypothetical protein PHF86_10715 [Candidatus Nanoarchaeia archaeon]|nr:hypothetical protein [Candidatus Nanoarchaeia archaeon]
MVNIAEQLIKGIIRNIEINEGEVKSLISYLIEIKEYLDNG